MGKVELLPFEADAQCLSETKTGARCRNKPREVDRVTATRLLQDHYGQHSRTESDIDWTIINLFYCGFHQKQDTTGPPDAAILLRYRQSFTDWARASDPLPPITFDNSTAGSRTPVGDKLIETIDATESASGQIYIFTCRFPTGLVKIGYVKDSKNAMKDRLKKWGKCYSRPQIVFEAPTIFPHRVEELIHRELAGGRRKVDCRVSSCETTYHNEWFECSEKEARDIATRWVDLMTEHALYESNLRKLAPSWKNMVECLLSKGIGLSAKVLLDTREDEERARSGTETSSLEENFDRLRLDKDCQHDCRRREPSCSGS